MDAWVVNGRLPVDELHCVAAPPRVRETLGGCNKTKSRLSAFFTRPQNHFHEQPVSAALKLVTMNLRHILAP